MFITESEGAFTIQQDKIVAGEYRGDKGEHAANNAEKTDNRKYFKTIGNHLLKYDEIFIFGPGKSQEELLNFLHEDNHFKSKKITLGSAEKMSEPQTVAKVREFFKS
jgi:stalled ribosome rescue protein Dom34